MTDESPERRLSADEIIDMLDMRPLPGQGGFFVETLRIGAVPGDLLPNHPGERAAKTAIYYLLTPDSISAMHRLPGDELFHHYLGDSVEKLLLAPDGSGRMLRLGSNLRAGDRPQVFVPGGVWQGGRLVPGGVFGYALLGTTMAPGFDFDDWVGGDREALSRSHPAFRDLITVLTPDQPD